MGKITKYLLHDIRFFTSKKLSCPLKFVVKFILRFDCFLISGNIHQKCLEDSKFPLIFGVASVLINIL
jgi:hypothetical protein